MKYRFLICLLFLSFCVSPFSSMAQVDSSILAMADWVKAYNHFGKYNPQEKVYLHFDNTGYYLGETMWFAAYVVTAPQLRPTQMSKVLYVELLTPEGRIVETKKLKIEGGRCHGEFALTSPLLVAGFYEVRAYTRVMLNWEGSYYTRVLPVFDRPEEPGQYGMKITRYPRSQRVPEERAAAPDYKSLNLSFYPEGGELVEGLPGRVAFKAIDDEGRSVAVSGTVYDSDERPVATLETLHCGMGSFTLTPGDEPCRAEISYNGKTYRYTLPEAKAAGYTLRVDNSDRDSLHIKIRRSRDIQGGWVGLTVSCRGIAHAFEVADLRGQEEAGLHLSKADFPAGVQQITLFTPEGEVLGERLAYHQRDDHQLHITVDGQKSSYRPYEKITLPLHVTDAEGRPVSTTLSVSVRDAGTEIPTHYTSTLSANLLLESDVKGYIEDIGYYFESDDAEHRAALDLLLLVQGWRRYEWRQQAGVEPFEPVHRVEEGIMVQGQVLSSLRGKMREGVDVSVWAYSPTVNVQGNVLTDSLGRFVFLSNDIFGLCQLAIRTQSLNGEKKKIRDYQIILDRMFSPNSRCYHPDEKILPQVAEARLEDVWIEADTLLQDSTLSMTERDHQLSEVKVKATRAQTLGGRINMEYDVEAEEDKLIDTRVSYTGDMLDFLERINPYFSRRDVRTYTRDIGGVVNPIQTYTDAPKINTSPILSASVTDPAFYGSDGNSSSGGALTSEPGVGLAVGARTIDHGSEALSAENARGEEYNEACFYKGRRVYFYVNGSRIENTVWLDVSNVLVSEVKRIQIAEDFDFVRVNFICDRNTKRIEKKGYRLTRLQGYSIPAEFYHIDYSHGVLPDEQDYRRTLYWNPALATDSLGRAYIDFYNNSCATRLRVNAETLTSDGVPGTFGDGGAARQAVE